MPYLLMSIRQATYVLEVKKEKGDKIKEDSNSSGSLLNAPLSLCIKAGRDVSMSDKENTAACPSFVLDLEVDRSLTSPLMQLIL